MVLLLLSNQNELLAGPSYVQVNRVVLLQSRFYVMLIVDGCGAKVSGPEVWSNEKDSNTVQPSKGRLHASTTSNPSL
jgi:hypothetical protein